MIENELKFIVRYSVELEASLKLKYGWADIDQAYLNGRSRIRRKSNWDQTRFYFTYKQRLANDHNVEIETEISEKDYADLLPFTNEQVCKQRVSVRQDETNWDIDFPRWSRGVHFIVAEAEMPIMMEYPSYILPELVPHIVFAVPRGDSRFNARRLIDENYAMALAAQLDLEPTKRY